MFNLSTSALGASVRVFAGAAAAAVLVAATPVAAGTFFVGDAFFFDSTAIANNEGTTPPTPYRITPFRMTGNDGMTAGALNDYLAFCIQLNVEMFNPGEDASGLGDTINATYADEALLDADDRAAVGKLVNYGTNFFSTHSGPFGSIDDFYAASDELAAVQGAIWRITNPLIPLTFDVGVYGGQAGVNDARLTELFTQATMGTMLNAYTGSIRTIYSRGPGGAFSRQGLAFSAAVPEPMSWVLMIGGFFAAGSMLRRSQRQLSV